MKQKAVIIDLDGTLADCEHRRVAATDENGKFIWPVFCKNMDKDPVNQWCKDLIWLYIEGHDILLVSGRGEESRQITEEWLAKNGITYTSLLMRQAKDYRPDTVVKKEIYDNFIKEKYDIIFCVDDRKCVVDMWRAEGLVCLQCAEGNF